MTLRLADELRGCSFFNWKARLATLLPKCDCRDFAAGRPRDVLNCMFFHKVLFGKYSLIAG